MLIDKDTFKNRSISDSTTIYRFADVINKLDERLIDIEKVKHKLTDLVTRIEVGEGEGEEEYRKELHDVYKINALLYNVLIFISSLVCFVVSIVFNYNSNIFLTLSSIFAIFSIMTLIVSFKTTFLSIRYYILEEFEWYERKNRQSFILVTLSFLALLASFLFIFIRLL